MIRCDEDVVHNESAAKPLRLKLNLKQSVIDIRSASYLHLTGILDRLSGRYR